MDKFYISAFCENWADEFDVYFFDIYTYNEYLNLKYLANKYPNVDLDFCFGTNEDFDGGFSFDLYLKEATAEEVEILKKFNIRGESLKRRFNDWLCDNIDENKIDELYKNVSFFDLLDIPHEAFIHCI